MPSSARARSSTAVSPVFRSSTSACSVAFLELRVFRALLLHLHLELLLGCPAALAFPQFHLQRDEQHQQYEGEQAIHGCVLSRSAPQARVGVATDVARIGAEGFLDAQQLVVFRDAIGPA